MYYYYLVTLNTGFALYSPLIIILIDEIKI